MKYTLPQMITFAKILFGDWDRELLNTNHGNDNKAFISIIVDIEQPIPNTAVIWRGYVVAPFSKRLRALEEEIGMPVTIVANWEAK